MKKIALTRGLYALVDDEDYDSLNSIKWYADPSGKTHYAISNSVMKNYKRGLRLRMHHFVIPRIDGFEIDHIDHNGLNNQKSNLRLVTHRQNMQNHRRKKTSDYPGVHLREFVNSKVWVAQITFGKNIVYLGQFKTQEEAYEAYKAALP